MIVDPDLPRHRKTLKLATRLGLDVANTVLLLLNMWGHCQLRRSDHLGTDAEDVAACCQCINIPAKKLHAALLAVGWIDKQDKTFIAHGWLERNRDWLRKIQGGRESAGRPRDQKGRLLPACHQLAGPTPTSPAPATAPSIALASAATLGAVEWSGVEWSGEPPPSPAEAGARARGSDVPDLNTLLEAKKRMCRLLRLEPNRPWSPDAERALMGLVPIPETEWAAVEWLHAQPEDAQGRRPKLRSNPTTLTAHWTDEVSKARQFGAALGDVLPSEKKPAPAVDPEGWGEWLASKGYPAASYASADASLRREFRSGAQKERGTK